MTITHLQDDEDYTEEHDGEEHEHDQACRQQMAISMSRSWVYLVATMNLATGRHCRRLVTWIIARIYLHPEADQRDTKA